MDFPLISIMKLEMCSHERLTFVNTGWGSWIESRIGLSAQQGACFLLSLCLPLYLLVISVK